jgi:hypothetical protein
MLAVSWLFPGKTVRIDFPCLDCGASLRLEMKDGALAGGQPEGMVGYVPLPFAQWWGRLPFA